MDCQWLHYLHSVGLMARAFRPAAEVRGVRALWRQRDALVRQCGWHIQHIHKALDQMNLQIHHVIADITGLSGLAIVEAILQGERDPGKLAALGDDRLKATKATLRKALTGDYRTEHLFCLRQSHAGYLFLTQQIAELDAEIEAARPDGAQACGGAKRGPAQSQGGRAKSRQRASVAGTALWRRLVSMAA